VERWPVDRLRLFNAAIGRLVAQENEGSKE